MNASPAAPVDPDLAARLAWRLAVANLLHQCDVMATSARGAIEALRGLSLPDDDPDFSIVKAVANYMERIAGAHAELAKAQRLQLKVETREKVLN